MTTAYPEDYINRLHKSVLKDIQAVIDKKLNEAGKGWFISHVDNCFHMGKEKEKAAYQVDSLLTTGRYKIWTCDP